MHITSVLPHPALRPYIVRYLLATGDLPSTFEQCTGPAGGPAIVVLLEGTQWGASPGGVLDRFPPAYLCGQIDRALLTVLSRRVRVFAVHFTAIGAYVLLRLSVRELSNRVVDLGAVVGVGLHDWAGALQDAPDDSTLVATTDRALLAQLGTLRAKSWRDGVLETATAAVDLILARQGRIGVDDIARQLSTTPRTLLRHFTEVVGLPVRSYSKIVRFLAARAYLDRHPQVAWSDLAYRFNYADQSHLVRDFRHYYGEPPSVYRSRADEPRLITIVGRTDESGWPDWPTPSPTRFPRGVVRFVQDEAVPGTAYSRLAKTERVSAPSIPSHR